MSPEPSGGAKSAAVAAAIFDEVEGAVETVGLPRLRLDTGELKSEGFDSVGIDIILATIAPDGEIYFLHEVCRKHGGVLAHPKETMQRDEDWEIEPLDRAVRRCFREELETDADEVDLRADPAKLVTTGVTFKTSEDVKKRFRAVLTVLWVSDFSWVSSSTDTEEVDGMRVVSLSDILHGDPAIFRESTDVIYRQLVDEGFFQRDQLPTTRLKLQPEDMEDETKYTDIDLNQFPG